MCEVVVLIEDVDPVKYCFRRSKGEMACHRNIGFRESAVVTYNDQNDKPAPDVRPNVLVVELARHPVSILTFSSKPMLVSTFAMSYSRRIFVFMCFPPSSELTPSSLAAASESHMVDAFTVHNRGLVSKKPTEASTAQTTPTHPNQE